MHREGEDLNPGGGSEDSDYESSSEQASGHASQVQDDKKEEVEPEPLPLLIMGSFARYACRRLQGRVSNFITAGDPYFSICARIPFNLHP